MDIEIWVERAEVCIPWHLAVRGVGLIGKESSTTQNDEDEANTVKHCMGSNQDFQLRGAVCF